MSPAELRAIADRLDDAAERCEAVAAKCRLISARFRDFETDILTNEGKSSLFGKYIFQDLEFSAVKCLKFEDCGARDQSSNPWGTT